MTADDWVRYWDALLTDVTRGAQLLGLVRMAQRGDAEARAAAMRIWEGMWR